MKRGQGTFEYVLLLGGVLLIVVLAVVLLNSLYQGNRTTTNQEACLLKLSQTSACYAGDGSWASTVRVPVPSDCVAVLGTAAAPAGRSCLAAGSTCLCGAKPV